MVHNVLVLLLQKKLRVRTPKESHKKRKAQAALQKELRAIRKWIRTFRKQSLDTVILHEGSKSIAQKLNRLQAFLGRLAKRSPDKFRFYRKQVKKNATRVASELAF